MSNFTATSCIGSGLSETLATLRAHASGLAACAFDTVEVKTHIGAVPGLDDEQLRDLGAFDCRNNRLAQLGLRQDQFIDAVARVIARFGHERIGVFLGTSTSGIFQTELAYRQRNAITGKLPAGFNYATTQNSFSLADFVRTYFKLTGPAVVVSTACSSSAKVFGTAARMLEAGLIDAAIVGGVDSLCLTTLYGFSSLELISTQPCRPFTADRDGISIGEAAAFVLLERVPSTLDPNAVLFLGIGESSDAYHMSSPHPEGRGAYMAMQNALSSAAISAADVDYINLHGTATPSNDSAEAAAVRKLFGALVPCSSTKGATGHTLGAAGGLEAVICALALQHDIIPGGVNSDPPDASLGINYVTTNQIRPLARALSNSFGFGGTNCCLVFGRAN